MERLKRCILFLLLFISVAGHAQFRTAKAGFTRADTLRGALSPERSCYDVVFYDLDLRIDTAKQSIGGFNKIEFQVTKNTRLVQVDLFENMTISKILLDDSAEVTYRREYNAVFISFNKELEKNSLHTLTVYYHGSPLIGKMLPWDGGFKWTHDDNGKAWIGVACQGTGASLWWPNKDHQSDEPDSMRISISVPSDLMEVSNGRLRSKSEIRGGYTRYVWFVSYPVNNYDITINIADYRHLSDIHVYRNDTLTLDYYVLPYQVEKASKHFREVEPMLRCYEKYFGKYPFYRDGFKLVETPYLGMEHQSCIAYGNKYETGYSGSDYSGIGLDFDYIIVHESAHEWWGNAITSKDIADMWIHEGFATYAEVLFTECMYDSSTAAAYINAQKRHVRNDKPVIGPYDVNKEGSGDMYAKGSLMLNTLRHVTDNDSLWFMAILRLQEGFRYKTVTSKEIEDYFSRVLGKDLNLFFDQYLRNSGIPLLEVRVKSKLMNATTVEYRWKDVVKGFNMPVLFSPSDGTNAYIYPTEEWQQVELQQMPMSAFKITEDLFYVRIKIFN
jgi:aminopeptidase N